MIINRQTSSGRNLDLNILNRTTLFLNGRQVDSGPCDASSLALLSHESIDAGQRGSTMAKDRPTTMPMKPNSN